MMKLQQLIQDMCPNGVEFKRLDEVLDYEQPTPYLVSDTNYDDSYPTPVLTAGQSFILGYTDEQIGIYKASIENPTIIFDDFTTSFHWVDFDFKVKSSAMKMLRPKKGSNINFRFIYYAMQCIKFQATEHTRYWISKYSQFEIPIPPLEIQKKIVECLDKFSALAAELQAELQMRRKQYEYYRTQLLTPHSESNSADKSDDCNWEWKTLGEICDIKGRIGFRGYTRADQVEKGEGAISLSPANIKNSTITYDDCTYITWEKYEESPEIMVEEGDVIFCKTASVGKTAYIQNLPEKATINPQLVLLKNIKCNNKYLSYYLQTDAVQNAVKQYQGVGSVPNVSQAKLSEIKIALPSLEEQARIVAILDKFEALTTSLSDGIPAEQVAQQKRYEYYRDLLLTFPRKEV